MNITVNEIVNRRLESSRDAVGVAVENALYSRAIEERAKIVMDAIEAQNAAVKAINRIKPEIAGYALDGTERKEYAPDAYKKRKELTEIATKLTDAVNQVFVTTDDPLKPSPAPDYAKIKELTAKVSGLVKGQDKAAKTDDAGNQS